MPKKTNAPAQARSTKDATENSGTNYVIPVRLEMEAYRELIGIKGLLITERRRNVSFSETVSELIKVFHASKEESQ